MCNVILSVVLFFSFFAIIIKPSLPPYIVFFFLNSSVNLFIFSWLFLCFSSPPLVLICLQHIPWSHVIARHCSLRLVKNEWLTTTRLTKTTITTSTTTTKMLIGKFVLIINRWFCHIMYITTLSTLKYKMPSLCLSVCLCYKTTVNGRCHAWKQTNASKSGFFNEIKRQVDGPQITISGF